MKNLFVFFSGKWAIRCHNFRGWQMSVSLSESWSFPASTNHKPAPAACLLPRGSADAPEQPLKRDLRFCHQPLWRWRARPRASVPSSLLLDDFGLSHHIHRDASVFLPLYLSTYVFCTPWWFLSLSLLLSCCLYLWIICLHIWGFLLCHHFGSLFWSGHSDLKVVDYDTLLFPECMLPVLLFFFHFFFKI